MQLINKIQTLTAALIISMSLGITACHDSSKALSMDQVNDFVMHYSSQSNDVVTTANGDKLEILVNLWKSHELIDKANEKNKQQLYGGLANKIVKETFAKKTAAEKEAITNATVNFVYVDKQDEYGKPDFKTLVKKAVVTFNKETNGKFTQTKLDLE